MSETPLSNPSTPAPTASPADEIGALRRQVYLQLVFTVVIVCSLNVYLLKHVSRARRERDSMKQVVAEFQMQVPSMNKFVSDLVDYSRTHVDVMPILLKYGLNPTNPPAAQAPAVGQPRR